MTRTISRVPAVPRRPASSLSSAMPRRAIRPMLAVLSDLPTADAHQFAYEFKWDGVRAIAYWDGADLRIESRNLLDVTGRYPELQELGDTLGRRRPAILDGEIVALDEH